MINLMKIDLRPGFSTGVISLAEGAKASYTGSVDTDLSPGIYALSVIRPAKLGNTGRWRRTSLLRIPKDPIPLASVRAVGAS